jgi:hypothetical protein
LQGNPALIFQRRLILSLLGSVQLIPNPCSLIGEVDEGIINAVAKEEKELKEE